MSTNKNNSRKKSQGQFYTTNCDYILDGIDIPTNLVRIVEPFAGKGDLLTWIRQKNHSKSVIIESYDIDPKQEGIITRDTLLYPPNYTNAWICTNPPYLARNKCEHKQLFDLYQTNDLYKCFINSLTTTPCAGGIIIIPAGFFFSPRNVDSKCRNAFMEKYRVLKIKYFEETVFQDTSTTIVVVVFELSNTLLVKQDVKWVMMPSGKEIIFNMTQCNDFIIGGDIYKLQVPTTFKISRHIEGTALKQGEQQTFMTLNAVDSGKMNGRIKLEYKKNYIYPAMECSRTYATLRVCGINLTETHQQHICELFNQFIEEKRECYWSLFLPQFRESKEYARKRIPFELAYKIICHLIEKLQTTTTS